MRFGLILSIALHAVVIAMLIITIRTSMPLLSETPDIPVEVVDLAPEANVRAATPETKPEEIAPTPAPAAAPQTAPPPEAEPEPEPEAVAAPEPKPDEKPETPKPPDVKPQQRPKPKAPEKPKEEPKFDLDAIAGVIDKEREEQQRQQKTVEERPSTEQAEKPRESVGAGDAMTISLIQSLSRQVRRCWNPPIGADQSEAPIVDIMISLRRDGSLAEPPQVENQARMSEPFFRASAEAAIRAINQCQPYDLPGDQYNLWREIDWTFDPSKMMGIPSN